MLVKTKAYCCKVSSGGGEHFLHVYLIARVSQQKCTSQCDHAVAVSSVVIAGTCKVFDRQLFMSSCGLTF